MWKQARVVVLLLAVVVGGCSGSDPGEDERSASEHEPGDLVEPIEDEWSASEHEPGDLVEPIEGEYVHGAGRGTWAVFMDTNGELCGATQSGDAASGVCGTTDDLAVTLHDPRERAVVLFGMAPEGTIGIGTPDAQESWTGWSATEAPDGRLIYAIVLHREPIPSEITFWTEADVIETAQVDP